MLRRFVYLNHDALNQYITALEGGRTQESTKRRLKTKGGRAGLDAKVVSAGTDIGDEDEESRTYSDTPEAQFDRLLRAAQKDGDALAWVDVMQPDVDFQDIGVGSMVSWECEIYVPQIIQTLARSGEARGAIDLMTNLFPAADQLGLSTEGVPGIGELEAMSNFLGQMNATLLIVGEDDSSAWSIAGQVKDEFLLGDLEDGPGRVVGKVSKIIPKDHSRPYMTFPGMNLVPREQRRRMERQPVPEGKEDEYLLGPALMLDILAVYR